VTPAPRAEPDRGGSPASRSPRRHAPARVVAGAAFALALLPALAGGFILAEGRRTRVVREAVSAGVFLHVESAEWLHDSMVHPETGYKMPASMTPGMPLAGQDRLAVEVSLSNVSRGGQTFNVEELELSSADGAVWPLVSTEVEALALAPGESVSSIIQFDVPESVPEVHLRWTRGGADVRLLTARPEDHKKKAPPARPDKWPKDVAGLPQGSASTGQKLFATSYGCAACHGDPAIPGSNMVGPHLGDLRRTAAARIPGTSAAQYVYDSILHPNDFIAPMCARGVPCANPSAMPSYGEVLPLQEMADLVAYLSQLNVRQAEGPSSP
jgi:mono/diheme cytochrome c family protein